MFMDILEIKKNIDNVKNNIDSVCKKIGIQNDILVVGASKTMEQDVIDMVSNNKLLQVLGENRVQELTSKYREGQNFDWHFIGKLQTNKVKYIIDKNADCIYSDVDVITPDDDLEQVDVIVVTAIYYFDEIEEMLSQKVDYPIISLEDILYEV